jgi:hypothetical protein
VALDHTGPRTLTLACALSKLDTPGTFAERLPKALIHHNIAGQRIHALLAALDDGWRANAGYSSFGPRQRWRRTVAAVHGAGWPVLDRPNRWRLGELTVAWTAVSPQPDRPPPPGGRRG